VYGDSSNKKAKKKKIPCRPGTIFEYFYRSSLFFRLVIFVIIFSPPLSIFFLVLFRGRFLSFSSLTLLCCCYVFVCVAARFQVLYYFTI